MEKWVRERLSNCLEFDIPDDMIKYILSMKNSSEFDEYFETLLNKDCDDHRMFLADCKKRLFSTALPNKKAGTPHPAKDKKHQSHGAAPIKQHPSIPAGKSGKPAKESEQPVQGGAKKKTKFVSLYANDGSVHGDTILLKGRRPCDCQASEHKLINNCLTCGRIVCEQEGSGPCLFCGAIVCSNEEMQVLQSDDKKKDKLLKSLKEKGGGEALKKALDQRDRLLEYDKNSEKRTTVIDDELDYFQENSVWLSDAEREKFERLKEEMHDKKHAGRAKRAIKIDFAGREVDDEALVHAEMERRVLKEIEAVKQNDKNNWSNSVAAYKVTTETCDVDPNLEGVRPIYKASAKGNNTNNPNRINDGLECIYNRVQDKELLEMQDMRQCLSLTQPYASLLVAGIKKHEGRVWYSEHRGRLWIASTVKEPRTEDIQDLENFYKMYYKDPKIKFPEHYPPGCLLGCVQVTDCLPQEEYRELYPNGESESPYVFVCTNPEQLPVVFPIKGQHKIYQIDPKIHMAACKTLMRQKAAKNPL